MNTKRYIMATLLLTAATTAFCAEQARLSEHLKLEAVREQVARNEAPHNKFWSSKNN